MQGYCHADAEQSARNNRNYSSQLPVTYLPFGFSQCNKLLCGGGGGDGIGVHRRDLFRVRYSKTICYGKTFKLLQLNV